MEYLISLELRLDQLFAFNCWKDILSRETTKSIQNANPLKNAI